MSSTSIYAYLRDQSLSDLQELYAVPWCALAVTQSLSPLSRTFVMRMATFRFALTEEFMRRWLQAGSENDARFASVVQELGELRLLGAPPADAGALGVDGVVTDASGALALNAVFVGALQAALTSSDEVPWQQPPGAGDDAAGDDGGATARPSVAEIERHAAGRWNSILHYLLGTADAPSPEPKVVELLVSTGLLEPGLGEDEASLAAIAGAGVMMAGDARGGGDGGGAQPMTYAEIYAKGGGDTHITRAGYEFLLKDTSVQLWTFLNNYILTASARGMRTTDILALLFQLGFCRLGQGSALAALSPSQVALLADFAAFGIVYAPPDPSGGATRLFYPSSLAILLTQPNAASSMRAAAAAGGDVVDLTRDAGELPGRDSGAPAGLLAAFASAAQAAQTREARLSVVVETNFKVYAYAALGLHVALLALFAHISYRLPNLVVATLTRRSVMLAYQRGIKASQILHFLNARPHSSTAAAGGGAAAQRSVVPENVAGQLILWERERDRVQAVRGEFYGPLDTQHRFAGALAAAKRAGGVLWADEAQRMLVLAPEAAEAVDEYLRTVGVDKRDIRLPGGA